MKIPIWKTRYGTYNLVIQFSTWIQCDKKGPLYNGYSLKELEDLSFKPSKYNPDAVLMWERLHDEI